MLGRLAAIVAKTLLEGNKVVVVRCEQLNISGNFYRYNKQLYNKTKLQLIVSEINLNIYLFYENGVMSIQLEDHSISEPLREFSGRPLEVKKLMYLNHKYLCFAGLEVDLVIVGKVLARRTLEPNYNDRLL